MINLKRRSFLRNALRLGIATSTVGLGGLGYSTLLEPQWVSIEKLVLSIPHLPTAAEGLHILQISDIHLYPYTRLSEVEYAVTIAQRLQPDIVVLTGDFVLATAEAAADLAPILAKLNPTYGIYACLGNHDYWTNADQVSASLQAQGIVVLKNKGVVIGGGHDLFYLAGLDDAWSGHPNLAQALQNKPEKLPAIVLEHEPDTADKVARDGRVALQLSGHSHGGQIRVPGRGALRLPHLGQKYDMGLYRINNLWLYTNRGLGVIGPPVRINCRPEITSITLSSG